MLVTLLNIKVVFTSAHREMLLSETMFLPPCVPNSANKLPHWHPEVCMKAAVTELQSLIQTVKCENWINPESQFLLFLVQKHQNPLVMARCRLYYFFHSAYFWRHFFSPNSGFSVYIFNTTSSDHENSKKKKKFELTVTSTDANNMLITRCNNN